MDDVVNRQHCSQTMNRTTDAPEACVRGYRHTTGAPQGGRNRNQELTVKTDMAMVLMRLSMVEMAIATEMANLRAKGLMLMLWADDRPT